MCEEFCLSHGCVMKYDYRSGFTICPQCEEGESDDELTVADLFELQKEADRKG